MSELCPRGRRRSRVVDYSNRADPHPGPAQATALRRHRHIPFRVAALRWPQHQCRKRIPLRAATDALPRRFGGASVAAVMARTAGRSEARCRSATCLIPSLPG